VGQILSFSRKQPVTRRRVDLGAVMAEGLGLLRLTIAPRIRVESHVDPLAPAVLADATQMAQVILNLCTNAFQAIGEAPGSIELRLEGVTLDASPVEALRELAPGRYARISVADSGHGMDDETLRRIYEPFFTTKPVGEGTGLGLSVVHGIVRAHGGAVCARSEPGRGATFEIYLPAVEGAADGHPGAAPAPQAAGGSGQHILYLDDDEAQVFLAKRLLERRGYRVSAFQRQDEALAALRADPASFDLLVTDYNMPGLSGLDVAREAKAIRPDLPVAVASGYISDDLAANAAGAGVSELIFKPNVVTEFVDVVERLARRGKPGEA
jgi:CheY-like chemotaxis protein